MRFWIVATLTSMAGLLAGAWMLGVVPLWGGLLIWPALGCALWRLPDLSAWQRSVACSLFMLGFCGVGTYWLPASASGLGLPASLLYAFWIGQTLVAALPWALAGWWMRSHRAVWTFPMWAIGLSVLLPTALPVFPAIVLGDLPPLASAAAWLGPAGASVLALVLGLSVTAPWPLARRWGWGGLVVWLSLGYGWLTMPDTGHPVEVVLVRPPSASVAAPPKDHRSLALQQQVIAASAQHPKALVLWPELNWPLPQPAEHEAMETIWRTQLAGPVSGDMGPYRQEGQLIPTQGWRTAQGDVGDRRSKVGVVPMIEDGWRNAAQAQWLPDSWQRALSTRAVGAGRVDDAPYAWSVWPDVEVLPFMCFEAITTSFFPAPVRHAHRPAIAIVSASDAWTPHLLASHAHQAARRLLAVSLGRPVVVATLAGPLQHIDAKGQMVATVTADAQAATLTVTPHATTASVYARWAPLQTECTLLLLALMGTAHLWRWRSGSG